jgi:hypothetical protein
MKAEAATNMPARRPVRIFPFVVMSFPSFCYLVGSNITKGCEDLMKKRSKFGEKELIKLVLRGISSIKTMPR